MDNELKGKKKGDSAKVIVKVKRFIAFMIVLIVVFAIGVGTGYFAKINNLWQKPEPVITKVNDTIVKDNYELTISNLEKIIKPANDLVTSKYHYKDADTYENFKELFGKKIPFTTDKYVFTYRGTIAAGVILDEVKFDINDEKKIIRITLPEIIITSNEIEPNSFEYPFTSDSVFNGTEMEDFTKLQSDLKSKKVEEVLSNKEFMDAARLNAEKVLEGFLTSADALKDYSVVFK